VHKNKGQQARDLVQDTITEHPGISIRELAIRTKLTYQAVQEATVYLRAKKYVYTTKRESVRTMSFFPTA